MISDRWRAAWKAALLLLLGLLAGVAFLNSRGTDDVMRWIVYIDLARTHGIFGTYPFVVEVGVHNQNTSYPPLGFVILGMLARPADYFHLTDFLTFKISLIPFTLACACVIAAWRPHRGIVLAVAMFMLIVLSAQLLGYIDVYFALFVLLAFWCLDRGWLGTGLALFVVSFLIKWQPIILTPLVLLYLWPRCRKLADFARFLPAVAILAIVLGAYGHPMVTAFSNGIGEAALSGQALNANWIISGLAEAHRWEYRTTDGTFTIQTLATTHMARPEFAFPGIGFYWLLVALSGALRYICYFFALLYFYFSKRAMPELLRASTICFLAYYTFGKAVHENHAFIAAVLALCWFAFDRSRIFEAVAVGVMFNLNLLMFYGISGAGPGFSRIIGGWDVTIYLAAFNVLLYMVLWSPLASRVLSLLRKPAPVLAVKTSATE